MMHHTIMSFRRDPDAVRGKQFERALLRRVLRMARPYRAALIGFVVAVVLAAVVGVIPALLFRSLLDSAVPDGNEHLVIVLAAAAVGIAVASAVLSLIQRWYSARVGEGLIYDMRVALFDHVQRMPLAFFTRTQTGSLMSRLNNDVIGAQQAVTGTLGTVISNVITLAITLAVMLGLEWRLTILTLLVLPAFIIPARRIGRKLQVATREGFILNASMNNTIAERFNVSGALVVKLFGGQDRERDQFAGRAARVRDIGVETAMYSRVLFVALGLVAAVGTAVVYYVGGHLAIVGTISTNLATMPTMHYATNPLITFTGPDEAEGSWCALYMNGATGSTGVGIGAAPLVYDGKVFVGIAGVGYGLHPDQGLAVVGVSGQYGRPGQMAAFDAKTGRVMSLPAVKSVQAYAVTRQGDDLYIECEAAE